jgi:hypothetical protein
MNRKNSKSSSSRFHRKSILNTTRVSLAAAALLAYSMTVYAAQRPETGPTGKQEPILPVRDYFPNGNNLGKSASASSAAYNFNAYARLVNGPAKNRVNIGITCDGYAVSDTAKFPAQADSNIAYRRGLSSVKNNRMAMRPYPRYDKFFNWYLINLVSPQSGISASPGQGQPNTTTINNALGGTHDNDRLGWVDDTKANAAFSQAEKKLGVKIHWHQVILNLNGYYNSGGPMVVFAYPNWGDIACHEAGHGFHGLADEYFSCDNSSNTRESGEINVTATIGSSKWSHWVGYKDIDPRVGANPGIGCDNGADTIGYYKGALYVQTGEFRPSNNSKMNMTGQTSPTSFNAICREKIIHDIFAIVKPIDTLMDTAGQAIDPDSVWVKVIDPNVLKVDWYVDGTLKKANGGTVLMKSEIASAPGAYTVKAHVYDEVIRRANSPNKTPDTLDLVRKDTAKMFTDVQWKVKLNSITLAQGILARPAFSAAIHNNRLIYALGHPAMVSISLLRADGSPLWRTSVQSALGENTFLLNAEPRGKPYIPTGFYFVTLATGAKRVTIPAFLNH